MSNQISPDYGMFSDFGNDAVHAIVRSAKTLKLSWSQVEAELESLADRFPEDFGEATTLWFVKRCM